MAGNANALNVIDRHANNSDIATLEPDENGISDSNLSALMKIIESDSGISSLRQQSLASFKYPDLYISNSYIADPRVASFKRFCQHKGLELIVHYVDMEEVNAHNKMVPLVEIGKDQQSQAVLTFHELTIAATKVWASDIHIVVKSGTTEIKFRINGDLTEHSQLTNDHGKALCSAIYQALADVAGTHFQIGTQQDAQISNDRLRSSVRDKVNGIRIATSPTSDGHLMVLRMLYEQSVEGAKFEDLGYSDEQVKLIELLKRNATGINIFVGPTGSGKSTSLKMALSQINDDYDAQLHILTVEDPPEYPISGANQIPVTNAKTTEERKAAFNNVVRASLRLDPDLIMIGEVRDDVTAELAINAAMTGHRVWTTLHANSALVAIQRLAILNVDLNLLVDPDVFQGVIAQRLVKTLCPHCKLSYKDGITNKRLADQISKADMLLRLKALSGFNLNDVYWNNADGCDNCVQGSPVRGRTVVAEVLIPDAEMMSFIVERNWRMVRLHWLKIGGKSMMMHAIEKISKGIIDPFSAELVLGRIHQESAR